MFKSKIVRIFLILLVISLLTRAVFLFTGFPTLTDDEADYYYSGYVLAHTGADQYGNKIFLTTGFLNAISSIPVYISAIGWKFCPIQNAICARLPFALLNSLSPPLLFLLITILTGNIMLAVFSFLIMNFSPWFSHLSATVGYDAPIALLFTLIGTVGFLKIKNHFLKYAVLIACAFLAFNSYMGYKTIFPLVFLLQLLLGEIHNKNKLSWQRLLKTAGITFVISLLFFISLRFLPNSNLLQTRTNKTLFFLNQVGMAQMQNKIWYARLTTNAIKPIKVLISNKLTIGASEFFQKYLNSFNPVLFFNGDPHVIYGLRITGLFYLTDLIFLIIGIIFLHKNSNRQLLLLMTLIFIAGIPAALQFEGLTLAIRGYLLIIPYSILIANGYLVIYKKNKRFFLPLIILLAINFLYFNVLYQARIKVLSSEPYNLTKTRIIQQLMQDNHHWTAFLDDHNITFSLLYSLYSHTDPQVLKTQLIQFPNSLLADNKIRFSTNCKLLNKLNTEEMILIKTGVCRENLNTIKYQIILNYLSEEKTSEVIYTLIKKQ